MSFTNIKLKGQTQSGFTIVELLVVVVVIAILAAITIVAYNGITNRANATSAQETASTVQKKAELFNTDCASPSTCKGYPVSLADLTGAPTGSSYFIGGGINSSGVATAPSASNGKNTVQYIPCGTFSSGTASANLTAVAGAKINYWAFSGSTVTTISVGDTSGTCATS
jgi:type IV pilus assembly protein PilA